MSNEVSGRGGKMEKVKPEVIEVDLLAGKLEGGGLPWQGEARDIDPNEDAWSYSAPPPAGLYENELSLYKSVCDKRDPADEKTWSYKITIMGRVTEKHINEQGSAFFIDVTTYRRRGAKISTAEGALVKLGVDKQKLANLKLTPFQVGQQLAKILSKNPIAMWEIDWRASYQDAKEKWHNVLNTYDEFPDDPERGGKQHSFMTAVPGGGREQINAQTRVIQWIGKGEQIREVRKKSTEASASVETALDLGEPVVAKPNGTTPVKPPQAAQAQARQQQLTVEDELDLS